ncbi:chromate efflux transporter [Nocardioides sp.]|uniref:chromate efflux transporter n=1 Tax=Nocardioides sp. TaxID=35761 RepID=UPI003511EADD
MAAETPAAEAAPLSLRAATRVWALISLQTFGGPAGQIAIMERYLVTEKRWIGRQRFLFALSFCTLLPGPEAQQLATYLGWLLHGVKGALVAGTLFVLPGVVTLLALSAVYVAFGDVAGVDGAFLGIGAAVVVIVVQALLRVARSSLTRLSNRLLALASFVVLALNLVPFPVVIAVAAALGWWWGRRRPAAPVPVAVDDGPAPLIADDALHHEAPSTGHAVRVLVVGLLLWVTPVVAAGLLLGGDSTLVDLGTFFSGTALITFGGAYAVLAFVSQQAVTTFGWLSSAEMTRGLGLAESTPGPLIMVVQFVGFLAAYRDPGGLDPWVAAVLGALLTTWVTFVPCFVFILLGAPYVERLRGVKGLRDALAGITAAVVGVIGSLALYFTVHVVTSRQRQVDVGPAEIALPDLDTLVLPALAIIALAALLLLVRRWSTLSALGVCAGLGVALGLAGAWPT